MSDTESEPQRGEEQLSPQEYNKRLRKLYEMLPNEAIHDAFAALDTDQTDFLLQHIDSDIYEMLETPEGQLMNSITERRKSSKVQAIILDKLAALLTHADVTSSCRQWILNDYKQLYRHGVDRTNAPVTKASVTTSRLGIDDQTGGIFNDDKSKDIESSLYRASMDTELMTFSVIEMSGLSSDVYGGTVFRNTPKSALLAQWRTEFIEKYDGEEP